MSKRASPGTFDKARLREMVAQGHLDDEIATEMGRSRESIRKARRALGLLRRPHRPSCLSTVDSMPKPASEKEWAAALNGRRFDVPKVNPIHRLERGLAPIKSVVKSQPQQLEAT